MKVKSYALLEAGKPLEPFEFSMGPLGPHDIEIAVDYCGICHSDLSMILNEWGMTTYPFVPGHEAAGHVAAVGEHVARFKEGDRVGLGWFSDSCMACDQCLGGDHNLCLQAEGTMLGRPGGFATRVRCHENWAAHIPEGLDLSAMGPLFCGGITVFNPLVQNNVRPTDRVGVVGIGGLGHLALQFLNKWGCEVTAFSTSPDKEAEARRLGAHHFLNTRDKAELEGAANSFDLILDTVNVELDWDAYLGMLRPKGVLHIVGAAPSITATPFPMILGQKSISASPVGAPKTIHQMVDFCARHGIEPVTEKFPMSKVNDALEHLKSNKARYRIVLENDL